MTPRRTALWVAGLLALLSAEASADRVGAEAQYALAQRARAQGEPDAEEAALRKAAGEDATFLPARLALGEHLLARGMLKDGLVEVRAAGVLAADAAAAAAWPAEAARAKKRVQELDATAAALAAKVEKHVADSLAFAARWTEKDPDLARATLERVLRLVPGHVEATERLRALVPPEEGDITQLFRSHDGVEYFGIKEDWKGEDGLVRSTSGRQGAGLWVTKQESGDFHLRAEARLLEDLGPGCVIGLCVIHGVGDVSAFGFGQGRITWEELPSDRARTVVFELPPDSLSFDAARWNRYEMRFQGAKADAWLNGKRVGVAPRRNPDKSVMVGLRFTNAKVEFRRVELVRP